MIDAIGSQDDDEFTKFFVRQMEVGGINMNEKNLRYQIFERRMEFSKFLKDQPKPRSRMPKKELNEMEAVTNNITMMGDKLTLKHSSFSKSGRAIAKNPISKEKTYFEAKVLNAGKNSLIYIGIGLKTDLNQETCGLVTNFCSRLIHRYTINTQVHIKYL